MCPPPTPEPPSHADRPDGPPDGVAPEGVAPDGAGSTDAALRDAGLRRLAGAGVVGIILADFAGRVLDANAEFLQLVGYTREDLAAGRLRWDRLTPPEWRGVDAQIMRDLEVTGEARPVEKEYVHKAGHRVPVLVGGALLSRETTETVAFVVDLTRQRRAEAAQRLTEERARLALAAADVGTFDWDVASGALAWDARCKAIFGLPPDADVSYDAFLALLHPEDRPRVAAVVAGVLDPAGAGEYQVEYRVVPPPEAPGAGAPDPGVPNTGAVRWVDARGHAYFDGDGDGRPVRFLGTVLDVTARKEAEAALARREADQRFLLDLVAGLALLADPAEIGRRAARALGERLGLSRCFFADVDPERDGYPDGVYLIGAMEYDDGAHPPPSGALPVAAFGPHVGDDARAGRPTVVADTAADPRTAPSYAAVYGPQRVGAYVHLPLRRAGRWVAALLLDRAASHPWDALEVALAREVAERAWAAVENARLVAAERAARDRAERLQRVTAAFSRALTPADVARAVAAEAAAAVGAFGAGVGVLDPSGRELVLLTAVGVGDAVGAAWARFPNAPEIPYGAVVAAGAPLFLETRAAFVDRFPAMAAWVERLGTRAAAFLPLADGAGRTFGAMHFDFAAPRAFAPEERAFLGTLAAQAAQALERARLAEAEHRARAEAEAAALQLQEQAAELEAANEELQAIAAELEERTEEADRRRAEAETAGARYRALFTSLAVGFCVIEMLSDADGRPVDYRFVEANPAFARQTGLADAVGRRARELVPGLEQHWVDAYGHVARTGEPTHFEQGSAAMGRWFDVYAFRAGPAEERRVGVLFTDVSAVKAAAVRTARLLDAAGAFAAAGTVAEVAGGAVAQGAAALGAFGGSVALVVDAGRDAGAAGAAPAAGRDAEFVHAAGYPAAEVEKWRRFPLAAATPFGDAIRTAAPVLLESPAAWAARYPHLVGASEAAGNHALVAVPLPGAGGRVLGVLGLGFAGPRVLGEDDRAFLAALAQQTGVALERARLLEAERDLRARAEAASAAKSQFLATISHEIRTPINGTLGFLQLLELDLAGPLAPEQRRYVGRAQAATRHLLGIVNEILDLAKVESGQLTVARETASAADAVAAATPLVEPLAAAAGLALRVERNAGDLKPGARDAGAAGGAYVGDPVRVRQVVVNLLSNAVKFTPAGGRVTVSVGTAPAGPGAAAGARVLVRVADTGVGIPPDRLEHVFEPFVQVDQGHTRARGGTGLGLAISRELARLMGGDLTAESAMGAGSTFTLWLPAAPPAPDAGASPAPPATGPGAPGLVARALTAGVLTGIVRAHADRLRADPAVPLARGASEADLEDHLVSLLADVAQALVVLDERGGAESATMRDGSDIQRLIAERHGAQRARLGWDEAALEREFVLLDAGVEAAVRSAVPAPAAGAEQAALAAALATLRRFLARAAGASRAAFGAVRASARDDRRGRDA